MSYGKIFLIAAPVALSLLVAPVAHAEWGHRGGGGWGGHAGGWGGYHGGYAHRGHGNGGAVAGALLGLGAAAVLGGVIASQPAYYPPPPPAYYPPQPYYYYPGPAYGSPY